MSNGAPISDEHDRVLRGVPSSTGKPVAHWYKKLDEAGVQRRGFLAALDFLRDDLRVPHQQASALAWSFFNPSMVPDELVKAARAASEIVETFTEDPLARRAIAAADVDALAEPGASAAPAKPPARTAAPAAKAASARKPPAKLAPAKKAPTPKAAASKAPARRAAARKAPAKRASARPAPAAKARNRKAARPAGKTARKR